MHDNSASMSRPNLLICFDAFGTLFKPKRPIQQQYGEVARSLGLGGFSDDDVNSSFKAAYKHEAKLNPNFGKANGMDPERWWSNIIRNTFQPLIGSNQQLPADLVPRLLHRFWSDEGYILLPGISLLLGRLRSHYRSTNDRLVVGVITNSDPRVPDILSSLGLRVRPTRFGGQASPKGMSDQDHDIDFAVMSYDVGHEKPDKRIFDAAEEMLCVTLKASDGDNSTNIDLPGWQKIYVGDEYDKDVVGAVNAGWEAVLIAADSPAQHKDIRWLDNHPTVDWQTVFGSSKAVSFSSLRKLADLLPDEN